jgi:hypothetical protein
MVMKALFGSKKEEIKEPPKPKLDMNNKEQIKEIEKDYTKQLNKEIREIERQILHNDFAEKKCMNELKKATKEKQDKAILRVYAGQVASCRKMKGRMLMNKAKIQGLTYSMQSMFANMRMTHVLAGTNDVVKQISGLMNIKEMNKTMQELQKSMMQFGLINEMVEDAMSNMDDDGDTLSNETELDQIIDAVAEPTAGTKIIQGGQKNAEKDSELEDMENIIKSM